MVMAALLLRETADLGDEPMMTVRDHTNAAPVEVQPLLDRIVFLERQIGELRRASREERVRRLVIPGGPAVTHVGEAETRLREAEARLRDTETHLRDTEARLREAEAWHRDAEHRESEVVRRLREIESSRGYRLVLFGQRWFRHPRKSLRQFIRHPRKSWRKLIGGI